MNGQLQHSLCDALCGLSEQANDIFETVGALSSLLAKALAALPHDDRVASELHRQLAVYAVALANAEARAEGLRQSLRAVSAHRAELEEQYAVLYAQRSKRKQGDL